MDYHDPTLSPLDAVRPPWLTPWFTWLDLALHRELLRLRTRYSLSLDELRGIYISDAYVDALLAARHGELANQESDQIATRSRALVSDLHGSSSPLTDLAENFGLSLAEACTLVICVAPEVEFRYQSVFAYLADDVRKRLPTIDLCLRLIGGDISDDFGISALLDSHAPIFTAGLVDAIRTSGEAAWRAAGLSLADPVRTHLLGVRRPNTIAERVKPRIVFVESGDSRSYALTLADREGRAIAELDERHARPGRALSDLLIRARLDGQVVHAAAPGEAGAIEAILASPVQLVLGSQWQPQLGGIEFETVRGPRITPATKAKARHALATLAQCVPRTYTWNDLVLPSPTMTRLRELASALAIRETVFDEWGFRRLAGGHSSLRILFTGASGTGKTMSAAVIAREVGLDLFQVDVSAVLSKYIGETEKNLEAIFRAAEGSDVLLFFDEADALFGKRSEVADAHDRYANIEASYLLQRVERYDGALILATNLPANMDEAFSRRLHVEIEFPLPDECARQRLWSKAFPAAAPLADDVDSALLAKQFQLTGGDIRNVALAAAFLAAHERVPIGLAHIMRALARQRHRQGKLPTLAEFGQYLHLVRAE